MILAALFFLPGNFLQAQQQTWEGPSVDLTKCKLVVSANGRYLQHENGDVFFYLGDTAWELFHRLNNEETERYLENRRSKGFTVIQAVVLAEMDGLNEPNRYGERPFVDNDVTRPNEAYFAHVDWVIKKAAEKGLYIGLLPTWGDKVDNRVWGIGPEIFTPETAAVYGKWIAERYKDEPNIIWINGGDRSGGDGNTDTWNALGNAIKSVDKNHLMTYHPWGGHSSSEWFQDADWLDFNMMQSGHSDRFIANYRMIEKDRAKEPVKPTFDGESCYEEHAINWNPQYGYFYDSDIRPLFYWGVLAGSCGITYGAHPIWQFYDEGRSPVTYVRMYWQKALDLPGASQLIYLRKLFASRPFGDLHPDQEILLSNEDNEFLHIAAARGKDYAIIYSPCTSAIRVNH